MQFRLSLSGLASPVRFFIAGLLVFSLHTPVLAQSNPVVRISTTFGDFSVELFEDETPATVANFMGYVSRGDYQRSFIHRLPDDGNFVVQGGGYRFIPGCENGIRPCGPQPIPVQDPVVNEPGISNTRGTLAMAKQPDAPDSATSQWFVNLEDNSEILDEQNGGFTVFGQVLGDGMEVVDRISELQTFNLCDPGSSCFATDVPLRDFDNFRRFPVDDNYVHVNPTPVTRFSSSLHVFESSSGQLISTVSFGDAAVGLYSVRLQLISGEPDIVFELVPGSLIPLDMEPENEAVFDPESETIEIPRVEVHNPGSVNVITNAVFTLQSESPMRFVLESFEQP